MKLEDQVCSLEYAKRLKYLGVKQESLYFHCNEPYNYGEFDEQDKWEIYTNYELESSYPIKEGPYSAFTVAELGEMLPSYITINEEDEYKKIFSNFRIIIRRFFLAENNCNAWSINYICDTTSPDRNLLFDNLLKKPIYDKNEADARAKMLIYLLEKGLIKNE